MKSPRIRLLLVADTHLGFDLPFRPRVKRRRRGPDFFANFQAALQPALRGEVDLVVHGGDLFYRSRIPPALVEMAFSPLIAVAEKGVPVYLVPGNHERSRIPLQLWVTHPGIHLFDKPRTYHQHVNGNTVALSGFPFTRKVRDSFNGLVERTGHKDEAASVHFLCMHQTVEGAQVGAVNYTFRSGEDVIRGSDIPNDFDFVLCGHIHRSQVLTHDLYGRQMAAPVMYPGSVERTSFAERNEEKGFVILEIDTPADDQPEIQVSFEPLLTRPMALLVIRQEDFSVTPLETYLRARLAELSPDSVVSVRLKGDEDWIATSGLSARVLRELAPPTMNISLAVRFNRNTSK